MLNGYPLKVMAKKATVWIMKSKSNLQNIMMLDNFYNQYRHVIDSSVFVKQFK